MKRVAHAQRPLCRSALSFISMSEPCVSCSLGQTGEANFAVVAAVVVAVVVDAHTCIRSFVDTCVRSRQVRSDINSTSPSFIGTAAATTTSPAEKIKAAFIQNVSDSFFENKLHCCGSHHCSINSSAPSFLKGQ